MGLLKKRGARAGKKNSWEFGRADFRSFLRHGVFAYLWEVSSQFPTGIMDKWKISMIKSKIFHLRYASHDAFNITAAEETSTSKPVCSEQKWLELCKADDGRRRQAGK